MQRRWFHVKNIDSLEIKQYAGINDHSLLRSAHIRNPMVIKNLMELIEQLPVNGEMMKSFSDDSSRTDLLFHSRNGMDKIEIYDKRFKTPSTGFNPRSDFELDLYKHMESLLKNGE